MKITIIVEGKTEKAFMPYLREYLKKHLAGKMPNLDPFLYDGRIPSGQKLRRAVANLLADGRNPADHVIAVTDVYTGSQPPDFIDAADAKRKKREWVGEEERFHPHAAQYEFEAWLLPYWNAVQKLAGHNKTQPKGQPETINHDNPPSFRTKEIFRIGGCRDDYVKTRDAARTLRDNDLSIAISQCPELKALVNSILAACEGQTIP